MARVKRGDRVVVADRPVTAADRKSGLYYPHLAGLRGVVDQVYEEQGEVCVEVDVDSLPPAIGRRHQDIEDRARRRWLDGLSDQERRALPEEQKDLRLKYTIMVAPEDLTPEGRGKASRAAGRPAERQGRATVPDPSGGGGAGPAPDTPAGEAGKAPRRAAATGREASDPAALRRPTEAELAAAEEAHLQALMRRARRER